MLKKGSPSADWYIDMVRQKRRAELEKLGKAKQWKIKSIIKIRGTNKGYHFFAPPSVALLSC